MVLRFHGTGTGGVVMFILVKGSVLVMLSLVSSSFSTYSPLELREMLERACLLSLVSSSFSTYSPLELREMLERAWHRELRSVRGEEVFGFFTLSLSDFTLVMVTRDRVSSSSFSSVSSSDVSLKYSSVCYRFGTETRHKNMNVIYIMRVW